MSLIDEVLVTAKSDICYIVLKVLKVFQLLIFVKMKWGWGGGREGRGEIPQN